MEVILKADVPKLGKMLEVVKVKDGYARNFLFPRKLAIMATRANKEQIEKNRAQMEAKFQQEKAEASGIASKLNDLSITIARRVVEGERLYGSVSSSDIAKMLKEMGHKVDKAQIDLVEPIKQLGVFTPTIRLFADVEARIKVWVIKSET